MKSVAAAWATVALVLAALLRRAGPWWRVLLGCAAWPAWPPAIVASYARFRARRRAAARSPAC